MLRTLIVLRLFATGECGPQFLSCIGQTNFRHMVCGSREQFDSSHSRLLFKNNLFFEPGVSHRDDSLVSKDEGQISCIVFT